jgi:signal peptidase I
MSEPADNSAPAVEAGDVGYERVRYGKSLLREYAEALTLALALALAIRSSVVQAFKIPSGSMLPTLQIGDHILVNKLAYDLRLPFLDKSVLQVGTPSPGDVVVFVYPLDPTKDYIKRVVGAPGDIVMVRNKRVYINGTLWNDPHAYFSDGEGKGFGGRPRDNFGPVTVPAGQLFVMGDNRDHSYDSRFWGFVDAKEVKGRAFLIYWSWDGTDRWIRWDRLGAVIH